MTVAGFSGHGFQHAPASGRIAADLVVDGETDLLDASPLSVDRFERGETLTERSVAGPTRRRSRGSVDFGNGLGNGRVVPNIW